VAIPSGLGPDALVASQVRILPPAFKVGIMKSNCIIIHGCPSRKDNNPETRTYDKHWQPWLKKELEKQGIDARAPLMPEPWEPDYEKWKKVFEELGVNENTILIGHSCGTVFLVRWLGETKTKIKTLVLVAPRKYSDSAGPLEELYKYEINPEVKNVAEKIVIFVSDNEDEIGKEAAKEFEEILGGKLIELKGRGHFTYKDMETEKFPELLEEVL
jgi:uncharacterized protein